MKDLQSIDVKILHLRNVITPTKDIYRQCLNDCIHICEEEFSNYSILKTKERNNYLEKQLHKTKDNPSPKYDFFDTKYFHMPSYFRRACLQEAIGIVNSYKSNYNNWVEGGKIGKPPYLKYNHSSFPTFYKNNTFEWDENCNLISNKVKIKLYNDKKNIWNYVEVELRNTDIKRLIKLSDGDKSKISNPTLYRKGKCWYLKFLVTNTRKLINIKNKTQRILAIDLGYTNLATCSVMNEDGTILHRDFIKNVKLIDRLSHTLNRIKKCQKLGSKSPKYLWAKAHNYNETLATFCAIQIVNLALHYNCDTIVMEHLDLTSSKKLHKNIKQKISLWRYRDINKKVERLAHRKGIHYSTVCAKNTSKLAFDGSGTTIRGNKITSKTPYSICKFSSGKLYNCDLNASYNIGARYFIRKLEKTIDANLWSLVMAKVPSLRARMLCSLDTLIKVRQLLITM